MENQKLVPTNEMQHCYICFNIYFKYEMKIIDLDNNFDKNLRMFGFKYICPSCLMKQRILEKV
jgi:hypothetical protein